MNTLSGHRFPRRSKIVLFRADLTIGIILGQKTLGSRKSDINSLIKGRNSRHTPLTVPFDHGHKERVKWCHGLGFSCITLTREY